MWIRGVEEDDEFLAQCVFHELNRLDENGIDIFADLLDDANELTGNAAPATLVVVGRQQEGW